MPNVLRIVGWIVIGWASCYELRAQHAEYDVLRAMDFVLALWGADCWQNTTNGGQKIGGCVDVSCSASCVAFAKVLYIIYIPYMPIYILLLL